MCTLCMVNQKNYNKLKNCTKFKDKYEEYENLY